MAEELELEEPALRAGPRILGLRRAVAPAVPDDDGAGTVVARRDHALEVGVLERVILDVDGEALVLGPDRGTLGHGPALQHAVHLEAEVEVQAPGGVLLDDEEPARLRPPPPKGRGCVGVALLPVGAEPGTPLVDH